MKEYKYRGFRRKTQEWVYGYAVIREDSDLDDIVVPIGDTSSVIYAVEKGSVGQYTELKDVEGKEIYEGDVIEGGYLNPLTGKFISKLFEVSYNGGNYIAKRIGSSPYGDTWLSFIEGKVVGNIYENPELTEGKCNGKIQL